MSTNPISEIDPEILRKHEQFLEANPQLNLEDDEFYAPVLPKMPVGELPVGFRTPDGIDPPESTVLIKQTADTAHYRSWMGPTDPTLLADKEALFKKIRALIKQARKDEPTIGDEELLYRIDEVYGAGSLRCDELIKLGLERMVNYDGAGYKHLCCEACQHASADIVTEGLTPEHTCIHIPDCYSPHDDGPEGQKVKERDRTNIIDYDAKGPVRDEKRSGTNNILMEVLDWALKGARQQEIRHCANALAGFRGRKASDVFWRTAYNKANPDAAKEEIEGTDFDGNARTYVVHEADRLWDLYGWGSDHIDRLFDIAKEHGFARCDTSTLYFNADDPLIAKAAILKAYFPTQFATLRESLHKRKIEFDKALKEFERRAKKKAKNGNRNNGGTDADDDEEGGGAPLARLIIDRVLEEGTTLYKTANRDSIAKVESIEYGTHYYDVANGSFSRWLDCLCLEMTRLAPPRDTKKQALDTIHAMAQKDGALVQVHVRVAKYDCRRRQGASLSRFVQRGRRCHRVR
jgi:hypothetical protein